MKNDYISELFEKYRNGDCTPEELASIESWYMLQDHMPDDVRLLDEFEHKQLESKLLNRIKAEIDVKEVKDEGRSRTLFSSIFFKVAAAVTVLLVAGITAFLLMSDNAETFTSQFITRSTYTEKLTNNTSEAITKKLSDGSVITLQPEGSLEFPSVFSSERRDVHLVGEAFFDVSKDKARPFIITTDDVTVKVLGTSFNVKAYKDAKEITVAVKTGKVSVFAKKMISKTTRKEVRREVLLTPNQEAIYNTVEANFSKKLVDHPQIILENPTLVEMKYDGTPVDKIFKGLEENYGIDIVYDERLIESCSLTTSMSEEGLLERIEIICQAIGAKYSIREGVIFIKATGCQ